MSKPGDNIRTKFQNIRSRLQTGSPMRGQVIPTDIMDKLQGLIGTPNNRIPAKIWEKLPETAQGMIQRVRDMRPFVPPSEGGVGLRFKRGRGMNKFVTDRRFADRKTEGSAEWGGNSPLPVERRGISVSW